MNNNLSSKNVILSNPTAHDVDSNKIVFFTPSTTKMVTMSVFTFGLYNFYWSYMNWKIIKSTGVKCIPILRSIFAVFFAYACFKFIRNVGAKNKIIQKLPVGYLAIAYFFLILAGNLPSPYWLVTFLSLLPILVINRAALNINEANIPGFVSNNKFSKMNCMIIFIGSLIIILPLIGTLI